MSGALGQGRNGTLDNWLHGYRQHFSATLGTQPGAKPEFLLKKKKKVELGAKIVHYKRNKHISIFKKNLFNSLVSLEAFIKGSDFMPAKKIQ